MVLSAPPSPPHRELVTALAGLSPDLDLDGRALVDQVNALLASADVKPSDGRANAELDLRTLRWYRSSGIVAAPTDRVARVARYSRIHLTQAVAVKVLQSRGWPLDKVQRAVAGRSHAQLTSDIEAAMSAAPTPADEPVGRRARREVRFWEAAVPAAPHVFELAPGVSLHIDDVSPATRTALENLVTGLTSALAALQPATDPAPEAAAHPAAPATTTEDQR